MKYKKNIIALLFMSMTLLAACGANDETADNSVSSNRIESESSETQSVIAESTDSAYTDSSDQSDSIDEEKDDSNHILVAYFSTPEITDATTTASRITVNGKLYGTTEYMAEVIHENTDSDLFKIELEEPYGADVPDRAKSEQDNGILPELSTHIENLDRYDIIYVGYPTWWYDMPQVMYSFFDEYDFSGKTIIPFNSHGGSQFSGSIEEIIELEPNANVITEGLTLPRENVAESEEKIIEWVKQF